MKKTAIALHLREFGGEIARPAEAVEAVDPSGNAASVAERTTVDSGVGPFDDDACALFAQRLADAEHAAARRYADEQARWAREYGEALAQKVLLGLGAAQDALSRELASVLAPIVEDALRARMLDECAAAVRQALDDREAVRIVARGPREFGEALADALKRDGAQCVVEVDERSDLVIEVDETLVRLRLDPLKEIRALGARTAEG